jgi:hypothetical protein
LFFIIVPALDAFPSASRRLKRPRNVLRHT